MSLVEEKLGQGTTDNESALDSGIITPPQPSPPDIGSDIPFQPENSIDGPIREDDFETLRKIVTEYKSHRLDFTLLPPRPRFASPRTNSGFTCNSEIRRLASKKAQADPHGTGGSLSQLIELLLWKYVGCPPEVVEKPPG